MGIRLRVAVNILFPIFMSMNSISYGKPVIFSVGYSLIMFFSIQKFIDRMLGTQDFEVITKMQNFFLTCGVILVIPSTIFAMLR